MFPSNASSPVNSVDRPDLRGAGQAVTPLAYTEQYNADFVSRWD